MSSPEYCFQQQLPDAHKLEVPLLMSARDTQRQSAPVPFNQLCLAITAIIAMKGLCKLPLPHLEVLNSINYSACFCASCTTTFKVLIWPHPNLTSSWAMKSSDGSLLWIIPIRGAKLVGGICASLPAPQALEFPP